MAKISEKNKVRCIECAVPVLMQWDNNPVIADCRIYGRQVANTVRICRSFAQSKSKKTIHHYKRNMKDG